MCNFHYVAMPVMASQISTFVDFTKIQKFRYFEKETFFLQIKKSLIIHQGLLYGKKYVVTFKLTLLNFWIKLTQKGYFRTKTIKMTTKFYIFKLI